MQKRADARRLYRLYRRVYSIVPPPLLRIEGRWLAAVLALGKGAVLSHRDALDLHGLRRDHRQNIDVTIPSYSGRTVEGIDVHRSTTLRPQDITVVRNIPVTTIARTILDAAEVLNPGQRERVFEQGEAEEILDFMALQDQIAHNPTRYGAKQLKSLIADYEIDVGQVWSEFEREFRTELRRIGMPQPMAGKWIVLDDGGPAIRADFQWTAEKLVVECDGWKWHRSRLARERNLRNDQRLALAGWLVIRIATRQLRDERARLTATIVGLLRQRRGVALAA